MGRDDAVVGEWVQAGTRKTGRGGWEVWAQWGCRAGEGGKGAETDDLGSRLREVLEGAMPSAHGRQWECAQRCPGTAVDEKAPGGGS